MDVFSTSELVGVVRGLKEPRSFLLNQFFPMIVESDREEIVFDVESDKRRVAPFVSPKVAGKVVESLGYQANTFKPAYVKDKRVFEPDGPLKRVLGEQIQGSLSPMERRLARVGMELEDQIGMLTMREEIMAAEALLSGQVTVAGEGYDTTVVNYGRDAALTVTLSGGALWGSGTDTPIDNIDVWADLIQDTSGAVPTDIVFEPSAWRAARKNAELREVLDTRRGSTSDAEIGPIGGRLARFIGTLGAFRCWVYQQTYVDNAGATQKVMPAGAVLMVAAGDVEGHRAYGVIQDEKAGYQSSRFFPKSWLEEDPAVRWLMMQSAPLVIPYRPNATLRANVL